MNVIPSMARTIDVHCWSKIFRKDFIFRNKIFYPESLHYEDVVFFWGCIISAKKIFFHHEKLVNYTRRENSFVTKLWNKKSKDILDMPLALAYIKKRLLTDGSINIFKEQFAEQICSHFSWGLDCFPLEEIKEKEVNEELEIQLEIEEIITKIKDYFFEKQIY